MTIGQFITGPQLRKVVDLEPYLNEHSDKLTQQIREEYHRSCLSKDSSGFYDLDMWQGCYGERLLHTLVHIRDMAAFLDPTAWDGEDNPLGKMVWQHMQIVVYG